MPREGLEPQNDDRGCGNRRDEHYAKRGERLIPARREPGQLLFDEFEFLHELRIGFPRLIGLTKDEAIGIEVVHVDFHGLAQDQTSPLLINARLRAAAPHRGNHSVRGYLTDMSDVREFAPDVLWQTRRRLDEREIRLSRS